MHKTTVFLVDDHKLFREGLRLLLNNMDFIGEVYEASNGQEFLEAYSTVRSDVVFMDIEMPVLNGIETTRAAIERYPDVRIIALSMYEDEEYYSRMITLGVKGFILKNSGIQVFGLKGSSDTAPASITPGRAPICSRIWSIP